MSGVPTYEGCKQYSQIPSIHAEFILYCTYCSLHCGSVHPQEPVTSEASKRKIVGIFVLFNEMDCWLGNCWLGLIWDILTMYKNRAFACRVPVYGLCMHC